MGCVEWSKLQELLIEKLSQTMVWRNPIEYSSSSIKYLHKSTNVFGLNIVAMTEKSNCGKHTAGTQLRRLAFIDHCIGILVSSHRTKMAKDHLMEIPVSNATYTHTHVHTAQHSTQNCQIFSMDKLFQECPWAVQLSNIETVNIFKMRWIVPMCPGMNEWMDERKWNNNTNKKTTWKVKFILELQLFNLNLAFSLSLVVSWHHKSHLHA